MALSILAAAGRELGDLAVAVLERLGMGTGTPRVSYVGGVFRSRTVLSSFEAYVKERNPKADVAPPLLPPIGGAPPPCVTSGNGDDTSTACGRGGLAA